MGFGIYFFNEGKKLLRTAIHNNAFTHLLRHIGYRRYCTNTGKAIGSVHYNQFFHVHSSNAITSIKRADFHQLLRKNLSKKITLRMGMTMRSIQNMPTHASVVFSDGSQNDYDLVVGADGAHSQLREQFFSYRIKQLPWIARYFWLGKSLPRFLLEWSRSAVVMCMPHRSNTTVLSIEYVGKNCSHDEKETLKELEGFYRSIGCTQNYVQRKYQSSYICPMRYIYTKRWFVHRIVLIGDAQHAMTPTLGYGTSLALQDASVLAKHLNEAPDGTTINEVLSAFSKKRERAVRIARRINRIADFLSFQSSTTYYRIWYKHSKAAIAIAIFMDWIVRIGWKMA